MLHNDRWVNLPLGLIASGRPGRPAKSVHRRCHRDIRTAYVKVRVFRGKN